MTLTDFPSPVAETDDFGRMLRLDLYGRIEVAQYFERHVTDPAQLARLDVIERDLWDALAAAQSL